MSRSEIKLPAKLTELFTALHLLPAPKDPAPSEPPPPVDKYERMAALALQAIYDSNKAAGKVVTDEHGLHTVPVNTVIKPKV